MPADLGRRRPCSPRTLVAEDASRRHWSPTLAAASLAVAVPSRRRRPPTLAAASLAVAVPSRRRRPPTLAAASLAVAVASRRRRPPSLAAARLVVAPLVVAVASRRWPSRSSVVVVAGQCGRRAVTVADRSGRWSSPCCLSRSGCLPSLVVCGRCGG
ncbi:hypothetical protein [Actinokineospora sp. UTMC 2448]|uniref:hypothetical protein n=1 Tax=Actinokineospora sp. UTMC 2448 TaxID=2268449 RepID=UPI0021641B0C|nr:hypothetical protein [Actinokineospora sp. UTMC 2448]